MDRRQLAGRAMNDQVHVRLIALEFKNSANNQLLRGTYLRRPGAVRRGTPYVHPASGRSDRRDLDLLLQ
jgi:hypothetical protein